MAIEIEIVDLPIDSMVDLSMADEPPFDGKLVDLREFLMISSPKFPP